MTGLLLSFLPLLQTTSVYNYYSIAAQPPSKVIVFVTGWGVGSKQLDNLTDWIQNFPGSHTVRVVDTLTPASLVGADALILGSPYGSLGEEAFNSTGAPVIYDTIFDWYNSSGNKFIWVSGDSDYDGNEWINGNMSMILETIGSHLRVDLCAVEDPVQNAGDGYRVVANETGTATEIAAIVAGVAAGTPGEGVLFHGPAPVYGWNYTLATYIPLHNNTMHNVFNVIQTSDLGIIVENNPLITAIAHNDGQIDNIVMAAAEINAGFYGTNKILVSGASPFGDYQPMNTQEYYGVPLDGQRFVRQAILWGLGITPDSASAPTLTDPGVTTFTPFDLQWSAAAITNGYIQRYFIEVSNASGFTDILYTYNTTSLSYTMTLAPGEYYFRVRALDDRNYYSAYSNVESVEVAAITTPMIPGFPIGAIAIALVLALGVGIIIRRRKT